MLKLLLDKLKALFLLRVFTALQSDVARGIADEKASLLAEAARLDREGQHEAAAVLRHAGGRVDLNLVGLDDLDAGLARLRQPDPFTLPTPSAEAPAPALPRPVDDNGVLPHRGPGRPRKHPEPSHAVRTIDPS